jgi:hypothetical protein
MRYGILSEPLTQNTCCISNTLLALRNAGVPYSHAHKNDVGHCAIARVFHVPDDGPVYDDELA